MRQIRLLTVLLVTLVPVAHGAALNDFVGTWTLDTMRSESAHQDVPVTAETLTINIAGAGVTVETTRSWGGKAPDSHETLNLKLDGSEVTSTGQGGASVTAKAHLDGPRLIVETARTVNESTVTTMYVYTLAPQRNEMTVDMTLTVQHGYQGADARNTGHGKDVFVRARK